MNRIFRLVWSHRLNALVVVSEVATSRGSLVAGPVVGHASWHAYRAAVGD